MRLQTFLAEKEFLHTKIRLLSLKARLQMLLKSKGLLIVN